MNKLYFDYKRVLIFTFFLFALHSPVFSQTEEITITTYYPSPYGIYEELEADEFTAERVVIGAGGTMPGNDGVINFELRGGNPGASADEGSLYYNNPNNEFRYHDGNGWVPLGASPCLKRQYVINSGNIECPVGYQLAGILYDTTEHIVDAITYIDNPLDTSGFYLCCPFCNDFDNDGVCD